MQYNATFRLRTFVVDGTNSSEYTWPTNGTATGAQSSIDELGLAAVVDGLYVYARATYSSTPAGVVFHVYIDQDGSAGTGFQAYGIGADYLIEAYDTGQVYLYKYNGTGTDWSWNQLGAVEAYNQLSGNTLTLEAHATGLTLTPGSSRIVAATVVSYSDDAVSGPHTVPSIEVDTPTFYEDPLALLDYAGVVIGYTQPSPGTVDVTVRGPSGTLVNYTMLIPLQSVDTVTVDGAPLNPLPSRGTDSPGYYAESIPAGYTILTVNTDTVDQTQDHTIEATGTPSPVPEPWLAGLTAVIVLALALAWRKRGPGD